MAKKQRFMDALMAEAIRLPGCPQAIVTRDWAYAWLKKMGYPLHSGFNSVDYMVFRQKPVDEPLTDVTAPWFVSLIARMEADCR
jgi:hypothetical protein